MQDKSILINEENIKRALENKETISCNVLRLAKKGKTGISFIVEEILRKHDALELKDEIFTSIVELVFNAIKANYKFLLVRDEIKKILTDEIAKGENQYSLNEIMKSEELLEKYLKKVNLDEIQLRVREILNGEEKATKIKDKADRENRKLNPEEIEEIKKLLSMMVKSRKEKVNVYLSFSFTPENLIIDIINDAPIFQKDLNRIKAKRETFRKYRMENREQDFYIENLDETESAGFGAAMIDARLYDLGVNPEEHFEIWGFRGKTAATLTFPLKKVKK